VGNLFFDLPEPTPAVPIAASVNIAATGAVKTIQFAGVFNATFIVQVSNDGGLTFADWLATNKPIEFSLPAAVQFVRCRLTDYKTITSIAISLAATDLGTNILALPAPAGDGTGAAVDTSALGSIRSMIVTGLQSGTLTVQSSDDAILWNDVASFSRDGIQTLTLVSRWMRVMRIGSLGASTPTVGLGGADDPGGAASGFDPARTIDVSPSGADQTSVAAAVAAATALAPPPSATNPALVRVFPGVYTEPQFTVPVGVALVGQGSHTTVIIEPAVTTIPAILAGAGGSMASVTIQGASGGGGVGLRCAVAGTFHLDRVRFADCETHIEVTGAGVVLEMHQCEHLNTGAAGLVGIDVTASAALEFSGLFFEDTGVPRLTSAVQANASDVDGSDLTVDGCATSLLLENGATVDLHVADIDNNDVAIHIANVGAASTFRGTAVDVHESTTWDVLVEHPTATYLQGAGTISALKRSIPVTATVNLLSLSTDQGDESTIVIGNFSVGDEKTGTESHLGEGAEYARGMRAFRSQNLDAGPFTDITTEMALRNGLAAAIFDAIGANNAFFVGGDREFRALRTNTTIAMVIGAGQLAFEISNGVGGWIPIDVCVTDAGVPNEQHAQEAFERPSNENIRFGDIAGWAAQSINGVSKFWLRVSIVVAITSVPTLDAALLQPNNSKVNPGGFIEYFGFGEQVRSIGWHQRLVDVLSGSAPQNGSIAFSANISLDLVNNRLRNNAVDGFGGVLEVPQGLDTSRPLTLVCDYIPRTAPGNIEFEFRISRLRLGDVLNGTAADVLATSIQAVAGGQTDVLKQVTFDFAVQTLIPGEFVAFAFFRDATAGNPDDTLSGSVDIVLFDFRGFFWR